MFDKDQVKHVDRERLIELIETSHYKEKTFRYEINWLKKQLEMLQEDYIKSQNHNEMLRENYIKSQNHNSDLCKIIDNLKKTILHKQGFNVYKRGKNIKYNEKDIQKYFR